MDKKAAEILADYNYELEVYEDYSGRGMYGSTTTGIVGSQSDLFSAIGEVMMSGDEEDIEIVGTALREDTIRTDSMGMQTIFY